MENKKECKDFFCRNCIDAIRTRGEQVWTNGEWIEGKCTWCEEEDEVTEVRFD